MGKQYNWAHVIFDKVRYQLVRSHDGTEILEQVLVELRIMNTHLASMTGDETTEKDLTHDND